MVRTQRGLYGLVSLLVLFVVWPAISVGQGRGGGSGTPQSQPVDPPHFQYMGPANAGRFAAIAGVPGDPDTYYVGAASGGLWKTTDRAQTFTPVFDDQPVQAIGTIAIAPSDPNIVWVGTGETWAIRDSDMMGDGVYKSTDVPSIDRPTSRWRPSPGSRSRSPRPVPASTISPRR